VLSVASVELILPNPRIEIGEVVKFQLVFTRRCPQKVEIVLNNVSEGQTIVKQMHISRRRATAQLQINAVGNYEIYFIVNTGKEVMELKDDCYKIEFYDFESLLERMFKKE